MRKLMFLMCAVVSLGIAQAQSTVTGTYSSQSKYNRLPVPPATSTTAGSVKVGSGLDVSADGTISVSTGLLAGYAQLAVQNIFTSEQHFAYAHFTDPDQGAQRDAKFGDKGIAVGGGIKTDTVTATALAGTGNGYVCASSAGLVYRSSTACN